MVSNRYYHPDTDFLRKLGISPPEATAHGTEDEVSGNLKEPVKLTNWRMEGPGKLVADSKFGKVVNFVSPDLICHGVDKQGLPILRKIS